MPIKISLSKGLRAEPKSALRQAHASAGDEHMALTADASL